MNPKWLRSYCLMYKGNLLYLFSCLGCETSPIVVFLNLLDVFSSNLWWKRAFVPHVALLVMGELVVVYY
ncbi:hypothetical protein J2Z23_004538 [Lederbergia galactosidilyticus]|nr:hypothetical protein [Lederbergia galactosidilytica]